MRTWKTISNLSLLSLLLVSPFAAAEESTVKTSFKAPYISKLDRSQGMKPVYEAKDVTVSIEKDTDWESPYAEDIYDCIMSKMAKYKNDLPNTALVFTSINEIEIKKGGRPFLGFIGKRVNDAHFDGKKLVIEFRPEGTPTGPEWCDQGAPKAAMNAIWTKYWELKGKNDKEVATYKKTHEETAERKPAIDSKLVEHELRRAAQDSIALPGQMDSSVNPKAKPCP